MVGVSALSANSRPVTIVSTVTISLEWITSLGANVLLKYPECTVLSLAGRW